jgi:cleavage and polyadenylation specificity factor subunit 1
VGTADGGLGVLLPLDERVYRSLSLLQQIMAIGVRTTCSLNPRDFRSIKTRAFRAEKKRGVLDGTLLWRYPSLPLTLQNDLAAVIGTTPDSILESLTKLDTFLSFF